MFLTKEDIKRINYNTQRRNKEFGKLTPSKKRVKIAKDVLKYLKAKQIKAIQGTYFDAKVKTKSSVTSETKCGDLLSSLENCNVCAIGGLFVGLLDKNGILNSKLSTVPAFTDHFWVEEDKEERLFSLELQDAEMRETLEKYFSEAQLDLIESAFEECSMGSSNRNESALIRAIDFGRCYEDNGKRLEAIMMNIAHNNGTFKP